VVFYNKVTLKGRRITRVLKHVQVNKVKPTWLYFTSGLSSILTCQIKRPRLYVKLIFISGPFHCNSLDQDQWYSDASKEPMSRSTLGKGCNMICIIPEKWTFCCFFSLFCFCFFSFVTVVNNYSPKWRWIVVDIYQAVR